MINNLDLQDAGFLEHPFWRYPDTRFFYPHVSEQRKVLEVAQAFVCDQKDPSKNLGVVAGAVGSGKTMLAMKLAETHFGLSDRGRLLGLYLNTNTITEPRHFLMAVLDTLGLPSTRSNANRVESIFEHLAQSPDQLLLVLDGPPVDQEYLTKLLEWSVENTKKIKTLIFLQDLNNTVSNIGNLSQFLGLYVPFRAPGPQEIANLLYSRCKLAGHPNPLNLLSEQRIVEIAEQSRASLSTALSLASSYLESLLEEKKSSLSIIDIH